MTENFTKDKLNRAVLVGLSAHSLTREENATEESMEELKDLLETAGGESVGMVLQQKDSPDPRTFIGQGKVDEVRQLVRTMGADMVIFDNALSPSQQRVLGEELKVGPDSGYLCPACPHPGGPSPGGAGPVQISAAPADRHVEPSGAPGGCHRYPRSW